MCYEIRALIRSFFTAASQVVDDAALAGGAVFETIGEETASTIRHAGSEFRGLMTSASQLFIGAVLVCLVWYLARPFRPMTKSALAIFGRGSAVRACIAGDGPQLGSAHSPLEFQEAVRALTPAASLPFRPFSAPGLAEALERFAPYLSNVEEIKELGVGTRTKMSIRLQREGAVRSFESDPGWILFTVRGGSGVDYTVRLPLRKPCSRTCGTCNCADAVRQPCMCKHGIAGLLELAMARDFGVSSASFYGSGLSSTSPGQVRKLVLEDFDRKAETSGSVCRRSASEPRLAITDAYAGDRHPGGLTAAAGVADDLLKKALKEVQHLEKELRELKQQYGIYLHQSGASPQAASSSSQLPPPGKPSEGQGFGEVVAIADAAGAIPHWLQMIREAKTGIRMLAFTFDLGGTDLEPVADALVVARKRDVPVDVVIDRVWGAGITMKNLRPTVLRLNRYGVRVRLSAGSKRLHAKILLADNFLSIGSCNWTANSQFQTERVAIIKLSGREAEREATFIDGLFAAGNEWDLHRATPCKTYDSLTEEAES